MDILQEDASESVFQPSKLRMRGTGSERDELLHEDAWQPIQGGNIAEKLLTKN